MSGPGVPTRCHELGTVVRAAVALSVLAITSCSAADQRALPPGPAIVGVGMDDFSFDIVAPRLSGGRTLFRVRNVGGQPHDLYLIPVTDDSPPAKEIFGAAARRQPRAPAAVLRALAPGERGAFAFDLTPGRYALVCLLQTAAGQSHAVLGMAADLRVEGRTSPASGRPAPAVPE